ncbi:MAG: hypothetical protein A2428_08825 [Bdellovibrionales bacterium RIFOXYC1_FULL_54_43]|nr:MAG: hypothetical protein A2428_08825 [Bdellovibrionales bacterium RIFOXYC1_FULL_54_43]OFZ81294.1 MAG: hypothetical protein A2603_09775 [Bdellovibrionales bacterium RIFOXYD1_FULL_55_31]
MANSVITLARRFLLSKTSDGFLSFIAWVSVVGVALGVLALVVVTSVINGFEGELIRVITGMNGDVLLYSRADPVRDPAIIETKIRKAVPEVRAITASFIAELMVSGPDGVSGAIVEGFDSNTLGAVTEIPRKVILGRLAEAPDEVTLGSALAERLGATEGSVVRLIFPFTGSSDAGDQGSLGSPKATDMRVVGIIKMGMYEYDSKYLFTPLWQVQRFLEQPGRVTSFKIKLAPNANSRKASDQLADAFGYPFRSKDWSQLNRNLFYAIKLEKAVIAIILTAIVLVAAFNVVSTLMMMIHDKTREIAILKAMGFQPIQSFQLFCLIGLGMGFVGTAFGIVFGLLINLLLEKTHWIDLPPDIYYIGFLPVVVHWREVGLIALTAMLISFLATVYPAWKVSRRSPLEGLRYE